VDHRTDVYALGATLYELLVSRPVFEGRNRLALLARITSEEPRPPRRVDAAVPPELEVIVLKALEKEARSRYATARELADDLRRFLEDRPVRARRPSLLDRTRKWARRHRPAVWSAAVAAFMTLASLAGALGWVVRDRAARRAIVLWDLERAADDLERAANDLERWREVGKRPEVMAAAGRAEALLKEAADDPRLAARARELVADRKLVESLEGVRSVQAEVDVRGNRFLLEASVPAYRAAFRDFGLFPEAATPDEAAARLHGRPPAVHATAMAALDHWLILARHKKAPEAGWLEAVLRAADADSWRWRVREARARNDRRALEELAADPAATRQPPEALFVLSRSLRERGARESALALLRRAREACPGDFWLNLYLADALQMCEPPEYDEMVRFLTAAVALRPDNPGALLNLGIALQKKCRLAEAAAAFRRAIDLQPAYADAHYRLGSVLSAEGRPYEALPVLQKALELNPDFPEVRYELGIVLSELGRLDEAAAAYRRATELAPSYAEAFCNLGEVLRRRGEFTQALAACRQGHELGIRRPHWPYPTGRAVSECKWLSDLEVRLPAVLRGEAQPADTAERKGFAFVCFAKRRYLDTARLFAGTPAADPSPADDPRDFSRYRAACAAARAARGEGADADRLDAGERARWRAKALEWLRGDLRAYTRLLECGKTDGRRQALQRLRDWQRSEHLARLREPEAVAGLTAAERRACEQLWAEAAALLAKFGVAE
jgi:tetratricopeptide (TPR) repeat protein